MLVKYTDSENRVKFINLNGLRQAQVSIVEDTNGEVDVELDFCNYDKDWTTLKFKTRDIACSALDTMLKYFPDKVKAVSVDFAGESFQVSIE
jgi:hypothetical protein